jgi:hypothetical protein
LEGVKSVKIVEKSLGRASRPKRKRDVRVITSAQGKRVTADRLDAASASFGEDLLDAFARNVDRVRRENKTLFGHRDRVDDSGKD